MPYQIKWEENGVYVKFSGDFDFKTSVSANSEILDDPRGNGIRYAIWDTTDIASVSLTEDEARLIASRDQVTSTRLLRIKVAIVARDHVMAHLSELYCASYRSTGTGWDFKISDSLDSLRVWVNS